MEIILSTQIPIRKSVLAYQLLYIPTLAARMWLCPSLFRSHLQTFLQVYP